MAVAVASGMPQYSGNFIPEIWSSKLLVLLDILPFHIVICE